MPRAKPATKKVPAAYQGVNGTDHSVPLGAQSVPLGEGEEVLAALEDATLVSFRLAQRTQGYSLTFLIPLEEEAKLPTLRKASHGISVRLLIVGEPEE